MKKISTGINPEFVKAWTSEEGIREVVQNHLDSMSEFDCKGRISWNNGRATVRDYGPGIEMRHLALGVSEKGESAIGKFGKGLKQALLVLAREGRNVELYSNGLKIQPTIEFDENFGVEVMFLTVGNATGQASKIAGTLVSFDCSEAELENAKNYFAYFLRGKIEWLVKDKLSLPGGDVYVNGSRVGKVQNALFSYHLPYGEAEKMMSTDRDIIDKDKLRDYARQTLSHAHKHRVAELVINDVLGRGSSFEANAGLQAWSMNDKERRVWRIEFHRLAGQHAVIADGNFDGEAEYRGYSPVMVNNSDWQYELQRCGVKTSKRAVVAEGQKALSVVKKLTALERANLDRAIELVKDGYNDPGDVKVAESLNARAGIPSHKTVNGLYDPADGTIYVKREILGSIETTVFIVLHETVHKYSGASDCTAEFESALCDVATKLLLGG